MDLISVVKQWWGHLWKQWWIIYLFSFYFTPAMDYLKWLFMLPMMRPIVIAMMNLSTYHLSSPQITNCYYIASWSLMQSFSLVYTGKSILAWIFESVPIHWVYLDFIHFSFSETYTSAAFMDSRSFNKILWKSYLCKQQALVLPSFSNNFLV